MRELTYSPEEVRLLSTVLDEAWDSLSPNRRRQMSRTDLAVRILHRAAEGERDPVRLWAYAITTVVH